MRKTAAQKYNDRMEQIFEQSKILKAKNAGRNALQILEQVTELVEQGFNIEEKPSLRSLARHARGVLEYKDAYIKQQVD